MTSVITTVRTKLIQNWKATPWFNAKGTDKALQITNRAGTLLWSSSGEQCGAAVLLQQPQANSQRCRQQRRLEEIEDRE